MLGEMFDIKSDSNMVLKLQFSRAVGVWQVSRKRVSERDTASAVAKAHGERLEMARSSCLSLLQAFQKEQGMLSEVVSREQEDKSLRKGGTESELTLRVDGSGGANLARFLCRRPSLRPSFACGMPYLQTPA